MLEVALSFNLVSTEVIVGLQKDMQARSMILLHTFSEIKIDPRNNSMAPSLSWKILNLDVTR